MSLENEMKKMYNVDTDALITEHHFEPGSSGAKLIKPKNYVSLESRVWINVKANRIRLGTPEKVNTEGALMTSQLCHNFHTSQAAHVADDIPTPHFIARSIL